MQNQRAHGHWSISGAVLISIVLLAGCAQGDDAAPSGTEPRPTQTAASFEDAPCFSIDGVLESELSPAVTCGLLTVPEDRRDLNGPTIEVAVARIAAEHPDPERAPMVYLNGGPGSTSILMADLLREKGLNRERDVIFVAQRGTLYAEPFLSCPEIDAFSRDAVSVSRLSPEAARRNDDAVQACHDRLVSDGVNLGAFNTSENAADIADLRVALGIDSWHVYGVSYGTLLALTVVRDHPEGIASVVLDSVVPPQDNLLTHLWASAAGGYQAIFDACAAQPECAAAYPDLEAEFTATVNALTADPLVVDLPLEGDRQAQQVVLDGYTFANILVPMTAHPEQAAAIPQMIHATAAGDGRIAAAAVVANLPQISLLGFGLRYGVVCTEFAPFTTIDEIVADGAADLPGFPEPVLAMGPQFGSMMQDCSRWDVAAADSSVSQPVTSDLPVLLMAGTFDAITQPFLADSAAATLTNSRVVRFPAVGHDVVSASPCGREVLGGFLDEPDGYETTCVDSMAIPPFIT
jgi:pimeloyl-ACP methyl ester carboxylesterase